MRAVKLQTDIRQEQIIQAAMDIIASQGLKGLTVQRVARQVGLAPSALYRHFRGKDEVLDAILALIQDRLLGNVRAVCVETDDPLDRLRRLLRRQIRLIQENQAIPRLVFSEEVYHGHPQRQAALYRTIGGFLDRVGDIVRQGQQGGRLRRDLTPETVALMFLGVIQPAAFLWHISGGMHDVIAHAERAWQVFSEAVLPR